MPNSNSDLQRKAGFYHSLGKVITETNKFAGNELYKSAHNVRSGEVWMDSINYAPTFASASAYADGIIVTQVGVTGNPLYLYPLTDTNYQTWFIDSGTPSAAADGFIPSENWVKPLINPSDVPNSAGAPSFGYELLMYRPNGTTAIAYSSAYYEVDYFAGLIRFQEGATPKDASNGLGFQFNQTNFEAANNSAKKAYIQNTTTGGPRVISFQYTGDTLADTGGGGSGTSGSSGSSGSSGTSGTDGTSGTSGTDGTSGTSGTDGTSGTSGTDGTSGTSPNQSLEQTLAVGDLVGTYSIQGLVGINRSVLDLRNAGFSSGGFRLITSTHSDPINFPPAYMLPSLSTPFNDISAQTNDTYSYIDIASVNQSSRSYISLNSSRLLFNYEYSGRTGPLRQITITSTGSQFSSTASFGNNILAESGIILPLLPNSILATDANGLIIATAISGGSGTSGTSGTSGGGGGGGSTTGSFTLVLDGQGGVVSTGQKGYLQTQYSGTITGYSIIANPTGSVSFDVWKRAGGLPTSANSIVGVNYPGLTGGSTFSTTTLTGWTTSFSAGDYFGWNVRSSATSSWVRLELTTLKT